jgi:Enoyl-CoA hydratase/carnithine racemase
MSNKEILVEKQQHIGIITLNRPDEFNTFNVPFARQLNDSLVALDNDEDVRVVVIRANGRKFSTGISLDEFKGKSQGISRISERHGRTQSHDSQNEKARDRLGPRNSHCQRRRAGLCL